MVDDSGYALKILKDLDPERYFCVLYLPENCREDVAALWAFDAEISRIPELVSEPMPGEIRLQWWRDLIKTGDNAGSGPLARALMDAISRHNLPREAFRSYLDARIFDLYHDPMPDMGTFEGYLGETVSSLFQLSALCIGATHSTELANASGHAGIAVGIIRLLTHCAIQRSRHKSFFPTDRLLAHGFTEDSNPWLSSQINNSHTELVSEFLDKSEYHLAAAREEIAKLPSTSRTAFLPICYVEPLMSKIRKNKAACIQHTVALSAISRQWTVFRAAMRKIP
ncbi:MAG: phytoene/squalene synthase family protein [Rhizobiaceae bacterium]